jgi:hypothetical protein
MPERSISRLVLPIIAGILWLSVVAGGLAALNTYESRPGAAAQAPEHWPGTSGVRLAQGRATLILFAHPQCSCSRASLGNLAEIIARNPGKLDVYVVFSLPRQGDSGWTDTALYHSAEQIRGLTVVSDRGSAECKRFGAKTSGQVMLYDPEGRLLFSGGITAGRSHYGDNAGSDTITTLLRGGRATMKSTPVFGCSLINE